MFVEENVEDVDLTSRGGRVVQTGWYDCEIVDSQVINDDEGRNKLQAKMECRAGPEQVSVNSEGVEETWDPAACITDRETGALRGRQWVDWIPLPPYAPKGDTPQRGEYKNGARYYLARFKTALGYAPEQGWDTDGITGLPIRVKVGKYTRDSRNQPLDEPENRIADYDTAGVAVTG